PLASATRGAVRPATAHGIAQPFAGLAFAAASRRAGGGEACDEAALTGTVGTGPELLRATRDGAGNGIAPFAFRVGAARDGTDSPLRLRACTLARGGSFVFVPDAGGGEGDDGGLIVAAADVSFAVAAFASALA